MPGVTYTKAPLPQSADLLKPGLEKDYDVIVCYDMVKELTPAQQQGLPRAARSGHRPRLAAPQSLGATSTGPSTTRSSADHGSGASGRSTARSTVRRPTSTARRSRSRSPTRTTRSRKGLEDFVIHDETYGNTYVSPSVHVLLTADNPKNVKPFAWTNHYGKSRVVYFQAGHDAEAWKHPSFQEILERSIRWAAGQRRRGRYEGPSRTMKGQSIRRPAWPMLCLDWFRPRPQAAETRSIAGAWRVQLDPARVGEAERWFDRELPGTITLPGLDRRGPARHAEPGQAHRSTASTGLYPYEGPAWFQYNLMIPGSWKGKRVSLVLERVHWETKVWIDGKPVPGIQDSLIAPHVHDLGTLAGTHRLTDPGRQHAEDRPGRVRVDPLRGDADQLERPGRRPGDPRGRSRGDRRRPGLSGRGAKAGQGSRAALEHAGQAGDGTAGPLGEGTQWAHRRGDEHVEVPLDGSAEVVRELDLGPDVKLWDEFSPALHVLNAAVSATSDGKTFRDERAVRFGMRSFAADGTRFTLNGRPIFLRGTLECAIFPRTGYPPTSVGEWRRIYRTIKSYGLNFMRFHSWCPPEAAFAAADLEGVIAPARGAAGERRRRR